MATHKTEGDIIISIAERVAGKTLPKDKFNDKTEALEAIAQSIPNYNKGYEFALTDNECELPTDFESGIYLAKVKDDLGIWCALITIDTNITGYAKCGAGTWTADWDSHVLITYKDESSNKVYIKVDGTATDIDASKVWLYRFN